MCNRKCYRPYRCPDAFVWSVVGVIHRIGSRRKTYENNRKTNICISRPAPMYRFVSLIPDASGTRGQRPPSLTVHALRVTLCPSPGNVPLLGRSKLHAEGLLEVIRKTVGLGLEEARPWINCTRQVYRIELRYFHLLGG